MWVTCNIFMANHSHPSKGSQNIWSSLWYMSSMVVHFWSFRALILLRIGYDLDNPEGRNFFAEIFLFNFPWLWRFIPSKLKTSTHESTMWKAMGEGMVQAKSGIRFISFALGKYTVWRYHNILRQIPFKYLQHTPHRSFKFALKGLTGIKSAKLFEYCLDAQPLPERMVIQFNGTCTLKCHLRPRLLTWITLVNRVWDEITYPFPHFNCCIVEVWGWVSNYILHIIKV